MTNKRVAIWVIVIGLLLLAADALARRSMGVALGATIEGVSEMGAGR